jgi:SAM-dependent methyltransferase
LASAEVFMTVTKTAPATCPACESAETRVYLTGERDAGRAIERPFTYFLCRHCRLRFQAIAPGEARGLYADVQEPAPRTRPAGRRELLCDADALRRLARRLPGRRVLDVGAGDGCFLAAAREAGFDCLGTDVSGRLAETARKRSGVQVLVGELADLDLPAASFDLVNVNAVLMYVPQPRALLREVARLLRPGGVCRIHEFDPDSLLARLKGRRYWMYAPTHVSVWPATSVAALARAAGLRVEATVAGREASLASWLATNRAPTLGTRLRDVVLFGVRKLRLGRWTLGADVAYYLRKPAAAGRAP